MYVFSMYMCVNTYILLLARFVGKQVQLKATCYTHYQDMGAYYLVNSHCNVWKRESECSTIEILNIRLFITFFNDSNIEIEKRSNF